MTVGTTCAWSLRIWGSPGFCNPEGATYSVALDEVVWGKGMGMALR